MNETPERHAALGLPDRIRLRSLTVSQPARCLLVTASPLEVDEPRRLFVRSFDADRYQEVPLPDGCNAFCVPVASPTGPVAYVLGMDWQGDGGNYVGLYRLRLPGLVTELVRPAHEGGDAGGGHRSWISQLLGSSADGRSLLVVRAYGEKRFGYAVCSIDPDGGTVRTLADLPAVFA